MPRSSDLYFEADVPIEATSAGSLFLHRLLGACEPERWVFHETNVNPPRGGQRLEGPNWLIRRRRGLRLLSWNHGWLWATALAYRSWFLPPTFPGPRPRAVYTVAHGLSWIGVVARARREGIRSVVHFHDHPASSFPGGPRTWRMVHGLVTQAISSADTCLAVSPTGAEWLRDSKARATATVYSVWKDDSPPPLTLRQPRRVLAYAGSIVDPAYRRGLVSASHAAAAAGWRMVVYPSTKADPVLLKAAASVVDWKDTVPPERLPSLLAENADAALITTDFSPARRDWVRVACPAKLADYAYAGLPVIAVVPAWSSLASVGTTHPHLVTTVNSENPIQLESALIAFQTRSHEDNQRARKSAREIVGLANNVAILRNALGLTKG